MPTTGDAYDARDTVLRIAVGGERYTFKHARVRV